MSKSPVTAQKAERTINISCALLKKRNLKKSKRSKHRNEPDTVIGAGISIEGTFKAFENVILYGRVNGSVKAAGTVFVIGEGGVVEGDVVARDILVLGVLKGKACATDRVRVGSSGKIVGEISTRILAVDDGGMINSSVKMEKAAKKRKTFNSKLGPIDAIITEDDKRSDLGENQTRLTQLLKV